MNISTTNDYIQMEQMRRVGIVNGKKILDENKMEYETPYEKKIQGQKNGKKYSMHILKKPKHVTFRKTPLPVYLKKPNHIPMKKSNKCKTTLKKRKTRNKLTHLSTK